MILLIVGSSQLKQMEKTMSDFLNLFRAALEKVAQGKADDAETKKALEEINARLTDNEASDADRSTAILELTQKLADSTPAAPAASDEVGTNSEEGNGSAA